jgi:8-oxo-dGTP pyrophosphatase MutT (NUDIX family)
MNLEQTLSSPFAIYLRSALAVRAPRQHEPAPDARKAGVALMIRLNDQGSPEILLIKRALFEGDPWSGHVALPGGRQEDVDADLRETAIRETREEISIDLLTHGHVVGSLDDVVPFSPRLPRIVIRPYVVIVSSDVVPVPSHEVAAAFWVPLEHLRAPGVYARSIVVARGEHLDVIGYQLGEHFVWGLTERILHNFLDCLDGLSEA